MKRKLVIIGYGGHGRVVLEAALLQDEFHILGFVDDQKNGTDILGTVSDFISGKIIADTFVVAIGNNETRKNIFDRLSDLREAAIIIHPAAVVSPSSKLGKGTVVLANSVINVGATIGMNCIINSMSLVDHETQIGNHSHISQGTIIGSNVKIGDGFSSELGERIKSFSDR